MSDFKINKFGRIVFEANFNPIINFSDLKSFEQFETLIERDFTQKASTEAALLEHLKDHTHKDPIELLREVIRHIYWSNRYFLTIYQASWCRWSERRETRKSYLPFFTPNPVKDLSRQIKSRLDELNPKQKIDGQEQVVQILSQLIEDKAFNGSTISSRPIEITEHHLHEDQLVMIATNAPANFPIFDDNEIFDVHL